MSYSYDSVNRPTKSYYTSNTQETYTYDALGRLASSSLKLTSDSLAKSYEYHNSANYSGKTTNQIKTENLGDRGYQYTYDRVGNITAIKEKATADGNFNAKVSYTYDSLNQLTRENNKDLNKTIEYTYDDSGNITAVKEYAYTTSTVSSPTKTITYTYDSVWKDKLVNYNGQSITYDSIGNPLTYRDGMTFSWFGRQMESANVNGTAITYKYNADGLRTEKTVGSTVSKYEYTGDKLFYEKRGNLEFHYRYDAFGNIASISRVKSDGTSFALYTVCNSRGDVEELRRSTGELFARYVYDSWGNVLHIYDVNGAEITSTANFAVQNPFRYRGYYYDTETGLYYLQSRYYDPVTHRFLNADNQLATDSDLTGFNLFAYCGNNPIAREDSGGQFWDTVFDVVSLAFSVVEVVNNPKSVWSWVGLAADVASLVIPFATGGGAAVKAISKFDNFVDAGKAVNKVDDVYDTVNAIDNTKDTLNLASGACFVAGTQILTATGYVSIEEISTGDMVYAKEIDSNEISLKKVKQTFIRDTYELVHLFVADEEIVTTPEHPFYVPYNGWVTAINLRAGDILVTVNGKYVIVEKIQHEILENPVKVYNFEVEDFHTYFVGNTSVLVHNTCVANNIPNISLPQNGIKVDSSVALDMADNYLGAGYIEKSPNRFVSADGYRQVRMSDDDILGLHGGGPHINFDRLYPKYKSVHVFIFDN